MLRTLIVVALDAAPKSHAPSPVEQEHIRQALEASQTAMNAINTILQISTFVLAVIGLAAAGLAIFGWLAIKDAAKKSAVKLADERLDSYLNSPEFDAMAFDLVQRAVDKRWQNTVIVQAFQTTGRDASDTTAPFPPAPEPKK